MDPTPSQSPSRRPLHCRQIVCTGYVRSDGLFDIEGRMQDTKSDDSTLLFKEVPAGEPIHAMRVVVTVDAGLMIHHIEARTEIGPSPFCADINEAYAALKGVTLAAGFMKEVKRRVGGARGCTHLTELLGPIATTAIQTMMGLHSSTAPERARVEEDKHRAGHPMVDTCYAWRRDGEVVNFVRSRDRASIPVNEHAANEHVANEHAVNEHVANEHAANERV